MSAITQAALILPLDGVNNGVVFTDWSLAPHVITRFDTTKTITDRSKYYGSCLHQNGLTSRLEVPASNDFVIGTGDFTLMVWLLIDGPTALNPYGTRDARLLTINGELSGFFINGNTTVTGTGVYLWHGIGSKSVGYRFSIPYGEWCHVAVTRKNGVVYFFKNGSLVQQAAWPVSFFEAPGILTIFGADGYRSINGCMQDLLFICGAALHTESFTTKSLLTESSGKIVDLRGLAKPIARTFYWDDPSFFQSADVGEDDKWSHRMLTGEPFGAYYLSSDNRCPPIIHGPYTAE